jgi:hypothetical protein
MSVYAFLNSMPTHKSVRAGSDLIRQATHYLAGIGHHQLGGQRMLDQTCIPAA